MSLSNHLKKATLRTALGYLEKNPEENALKLMNWVDKLAGDGADSFPVQRAAVRQVLENPDSNMHQLVMKIMKETDGEVLKATFDTAAIFHGQSFWIPLLPAICTAPDAGRQSMETS